MPPEVVSDARRRVLSPQPVMTCISTLVRLFQLATSDAATWMSYRAVKNDHTSAGTQLQGQVVEQVLGGVAHEL